MVTTDGAVRLIEINTSPALFRHGRALTALFPELMEELFQKVVDPLFPPPAGTAAPPALDRFELLQVGGALRQVPSPGGT